MFFIFWFGTAPNSKEMGKEMGYGRGGTIYIRVYGDVQQSWGGCFLGKTKQVTTLCGFVGGGLGLRRTLRAISCGSFVNPAYLGGGSQCLLGFADPSC